VDPESSSGASSDSSSRATERSEHERAAARAGWVASLADWIAWFGPGRLVTSAIAVIIVCGGVFWLVRSTPPSTEAGLPVATSIVSSSSTVQADVTPAVPEVSGPVSVHVAGAVERAGVYELEPGSRVYAAIAAAGGATSAADPDALNLAAEVVDGSRVYVPVVGETLPAPLVDPGSGEPAGPPAPVDVNRATAGELDVLPGVGPATATAIVTERDRNGPFLSVDDLERVPGIGPAKLDALRELVTT
jgi:competence protein ComEA